MPTSVRGQIVGKSGCGKTTLLLNLLLQPVCLDYSKLSVFGKSLFQPEYKISRKGLEQLPKDMIMSLDENCDEIQREGIPPDILIEELSKSNKRRQPIECNLLIRQMTFRTPKSCSQNIKISWYLTTFCYEKKKCEAYYVRGRHSTDRM